MEMPNIKPGKDRQLLGFASVVVSSFCFLIQDYEYAFVSSESTRVVYRSELVETAIYHARGSYLLGVDFTLLSEQIKLQLGEMIQYLKIRDPQCNPYSPSTPNGVQIGVSRLSVCVQQHCHPLLCGVQGQYYQIAELRRRDMEKYSRNDPTTRSDGQRDS